MSIQGNINGMLGTAAGALAAGKHLKQQKQANEVAAEQAAEQATKEMQPLIDENKVDMEAYSKASAELKAKNKDMKLAKSFLDGSAEVTEENMEYLQSNYPELMAVDEAQRQEGIDAINKDIQKFKTAKKTLKAKQEATVQQVAERMQHIARIKAKGGIN